MSRFDKGGDTKLPVSGEKDVRPTFNFGVAGAAQKQEEPPINEVPSGARGDAAALEMANREIARLRAELAKVPAVVVPAGAAPGAGAGPASPTKTGGKKEILWSSGMGFHKT